MYFRREVFYLEYKIVKYIFLSLESDILITIFLKNNQIYTLSKQ